MKKDSVFFTITLSFLLSIILLCVSFSLIVLNKHRIDEDNLKKRYFPIARTFLQEYKNINSNPSFIDDFKVKNIEILTNRKDRSALIYNPKTKILLQRELKNYLVRVISLDKTNYIYIKRKNIASTVDVFILKDNKTEDKNGLLMYVLGFLIVLLLFIVFYISTLKKLYSLKVLSDKIPHLSNENFDFTCCETNKTDEISLLALRFKDTAFKLGELKESRNIFIANLMNDINSAVIEGKELIHSKNREENLQKLEEVFSKLDILVDDFSSMKEMILSNRKDIEVNDYYLEEIIEKALLKLDMTNHSLSYKYQNIKLSVNDKLFSVAIKNLLDNALKYGSDNSVEISTVNNDIIIKNAGDILSNELNTYFTPYIKDENKVNENFGLGLYIVKNILELNNYKLEYEYKDGINIFKCVKL